MNADGDAVLYHELLALARDDGLTALDVHVVQAPAEANGHTAVVQAIARTLQGSFAAIGEASCASAPADWQPFLITLAELRAKARAIRELTGLEHTVPEERGTPYLLGHGPAATAPLAGSRRQALQDGVGYGGAHQWPTRRQGDGAAAPPLRNTSTSTVGSAHVDTAGQEAGAGEDVAASQPAGAPGPTAPPAEPGLRDQPEPDFEGIGRDMEAKLLKLAITIAAMEGTDLSDAEAHQKLDDFFLRAFKRPLNRASRIEGQRVVQRLSSELSRLRNASQDAKE